MCLGVGAASMANLTFMVGGVEEEYNAAQELLTCMGANAVYCGQVGSGQVRTNVEHLSLGRTEVPKCRFSADEQSSSANVGHSRIKKYLPCES